MAVAREGSERARPRARPDQPDLPSRRRVPRDRAARTTSAWASSRSSRPCGGGRNATPPPAAPTRACVLPPLDAALKPTRFAGGCRPSRPGSTPIPASTWRCRCSRRHRPGRCSRTACMNSLILIAGALAATLGFALLLGAAMGSRVGAAALAGAGGHGHAAILADRADPGHRRGDRARLLHLFRRRRARRRHRGPGPRPTAAMPARRSAEAMVSLRAEQGGPAVAGQAAARRCSAARSAARRRRSWPS